LLDIGAIDPYRNFVFRFTSSGTSVTTDTFPIVYNKTILHLELVNGLVEREHENDSMLTTKVELAKCSIVIDVTLRVF
jgi:hypothetical protein